MATREERTALMAATCHHCGSAPGEPCVIPHARARAADQGHSGRSLPGPSTLEAGCHDARWQTALGRSAPVRVEVLAEVTGRPVGGVLVAAGVSDDGSRPW